MKSTITFISFFLLGSSFARAQDKLDFTKINEAMTPSPIVIMKDTFQCKRISEVKLYEVYKEGKYNAARKEAYKQLNENLGHLDRALTFLANNSAYVSKEANLGSLKYAIEDSRKYFPSFDISGYEAIYTALRQKFDQEKDAERLAEIKEKQEEAAHQKKLVKQEKENEVKKKQAAIDKKKQDSLEEVAMLTIEEGGQEYEVGYKKEYREQMGFMSGHPHLCRFIGFKYYWVTQIPKFLIEEGSFDLVSADLGADNNLVIKMKPSSRNAAFYGNMQIKAKVNADQRVTSLVITGSSVSLTHLFLWYWPTTPNLTKNSKLTTGAVYKKMLFDENITFNYGATPTITIVKRK